MVKFFFLINPISGGGQGKVVHEFLPDIMRSMDFRDEEWRAEFTKALGMREQIRTALAEAETLIAVGGDGTVSAVLSEMVEHPRRGEVKIGLVPFGTGNDLSRVLGLYKPFVEQGLLYLIRSLILANPISFDIWRVGGRGAFANYFSAGIDARIAHGFDKARKTGKIRSNSAIANKLHYVRIFFAERRYSIGSGFLTVVNERGGKEVIDLTGFRSVIIGNIPSFASGTNPFLNSNMADGLLEVVCVPNMFSFLGVLALGTVPVLGKIFKRYLMKSYKASYVRLDVAANEFLQLDGEDLSGKFSGGVELTYGCQVQMLSLRSE